MAASSPPLHALPRKHMLTLYPSVFITEALAERHLLQRTTHLPRVIYFHPVKGRLNILTRPQQFSSCREPCVQSSLVI